MANIYCKNLQINIDEDVKRDIKAEAAKRGMTLSALIETLIKEYLNGKPAEAK